jgi:hypothetical protein
MRAKHPKAKDKPVVEPIADAPPDRTINEYAPAAVFTMPPEPKAPWKILVQEIKTATRLHNRGQDFTIDGKTSEADANGTAQRRARDLGLVAPFKVQVLTHPDGKSGSEQRRVKKGSDGKPVEGEAVAS